MANLQKGMTKTGRKAARVGAFQELFARQFHGDIDTKAPVLDEIKNADAHYMQFLIDGVWQHRDRLDEIIQNYSPKRKVSRFSPADITILRLGIWELINTADPLEPMIAINSAVEIAKTYAHDSSYKVVNAILDKVVKDKIVL